jgi:hypothetical protein
MRQGNGHVSLWVGAAASVFLVSGSGTAFAAKPTAGASGCQIDSTRATIQHVIHIQFDNTHLTRDNPNVPSDLEQMPSLLNFMEQQGVLLINDHT